MANNFDFNDVSRRMDGALAVLRKEFAGLRTGRASASLLEPVQVEAYGSRMPINQVATVNVPEPRLITVQVWDKSQVKSVEKAIRESGLGLNPQTDGQLVRVPIPDLTEERRKELAKLASQYAENARIAVRNVRRDGNEAIKEDEKKKEISEDDRKRLEGEVQKLTDDMIKQVDEELARKEKDILSQ